MATLTGNGLQFVLFTVFSCPREGKLHWTPGMHLAFSYLTLDTLETGVSVSVDKEGFCVPGGRRTCGGPQGRSQSEVQLYACSAWCLCLSLLQESVALGYHLQPWCPLSLLPDAILPWASSQGHMFLVNPDLPDASPTCFHTACSCPAITAKDPRAPMMLCLSSAAMITTSYIIVRRLLLLFELFSLKK